MCARAHPHKNQKPTPLEAPEIWTKMGGMTPRPFKTTRTTRNDKNDEKDENDKNEESDKNDEKQRQKGREMISSFSLFSSRIDESFCFR